jgi:hypothetical protein
MQVGRIYVERKKVLEEFGVSRLTPQLRKKALKSLQAEVEIYDAYLKGEVYGYDTGKDSCWGYIGEEGLEYAIDEAKRAIDSQIDDAIKDHVKQVKEWIKAKVPLIYRQPLAV